MVDETAFEWMKDIDFEALKDPPEPFKLLVPDNDDFEFFKKKRQIKKYMLERYLYLSDEYRNPEYVDSSVEVMLHSPFNAFYEIGDFQGLFGFANIVPAYKCGLVLKLWDKKQWNKTLVRAAGKLIDMYMSEFRLMRIHTQTADPKIGRMAEMVGFKKDGTCPNDFIWHGEFKPLFIYSLTPKEK